MRIDKLESITREMDRYKVNVIGLTETSWKETGDF